MAGTQYGSVKIWNCQSGKLLADVVVNSTPVFHMSLGADDSLVMIADRNTARLWTLADFYEATEDEYNRKFDNPANEEAQEQVSNTDFSEEQIDQPPTQIKPKCIIEYLGHENFIKGVAISSFSTIAFTCSKDKSCIIWDLFSGSRLKTITCNSPIV